MNNIITKLRDLIEDNLKYTSDTFIYNGISKIFTLSEANISASTLKCYKNGALFAASNYTYDSLTSKVTVTGTLLTGDVLEFAYNAYEKYSDNELRGYIRGALVYLSTGKYQVFVARDDNEIFPTPSEAEESLIALIACILRKGSIREYRTPEITISFNNDVSKEKQIRTVIQQFSKTYGIVKYIKTDKDIALDREDD